MESIDRLRRYVECHDKITGLTATCINHLIDSIEKEVEGMRDFCERLDDAATKREDVTLWGVDYTALPVDAEGEYVRIGDVMEWPDCSTAEVVGIGDDRFFYAEDGLRYAWASDKIHHHAPTVEDVLREFGDWYAHTKGGCDEDGIIAEYAAKLRLAGDE